MQKKVGLFGKQLRALRIGKGLSLEKAAKACRTQKGYLCGIEMGAVRPPAPKTIKRIAAFFKVEYARLLALAWVDKAPIGMDRKVASDLLTSVK